MIRFDQLMAHRFYEFFAGGGMVSHGLSPRWRCLFANDIDRAKAASYRANNDPAPFHLGDIRDLTVGDLPGQADLAWASFPCQDLSLAGGGAGLNGSRSGAFWAFWDLMTDLRHAARAPRIIALENVAGAVTADHGAALRSIAAAFQECGYRFSAMMIDAIHFVPQSRPRLFIIGVQDTMTIPDAMTAPTPVDALDAPALRRIIATFPPSVFEQMINWRLPRPPARNTALIDVVDHAPVGVKWHSNDETARLLSLMDDNNRAKVLTAQNAKAHAVGAIYRRTRTDKTGAKVQRAEVRFDGAAGCLRTPGGGSSRQTLIFIDGDNIRSRLLSPIEAARLMGLPDDYKMPARYNEAYHLAGDGVVVPVIRYLCDYLFDPLLSANAAAPRQKVLAAE